jgi:site-specific recombinase XerD
LKIFDKEGSMFYSKDFLNHLKEKGYRKKTIMGYAYLLHNFEKYFDNHGIIDVENITENEVHEYLSVLRNRRISEKEYALTISRLRKYFQYLEDNNHIFLSPVKDYTTIKYQSKRYPTLNQEEIENILQNIKIDHPLCLKGKAIIELAYSSALRPREIYNLKTTDIDYKKGLLFIEQSKNQKDRIVPVGEKALFWIGKYIREVHSIYLHSKSHNYIFINHKTGEKLTVWGIRWAIQETLRLSGLKPIKPYSLRSTAATALLLNGMGIAYISKLLGHADIRTTQLYLHVKTLELKRELAQKHPRTCFVRLAKSNQIEMKEVPINEV